jgi:hypothetical protein
MGERRTASHQIEALHVQMFGPVGLYIYTPDGNGESEDTQPAEWRRSELKCCLQG